MIPTDTATPEQRAKYEAYASSRTAAHRDAAGTGPAAVRAATSSARATQIAERAATRTPRSARCDEVAFALPFTFEHEDYVQILTDMATKLGPALGWRPAR